GRELALGEGTALSSWIDVAARRVRDAGLVTVIQRAEGLPELIALMGARLGSVEVLPLTPRRGRPAQLVLIRGRKGGRAPFRLADSVLMHEGAAHDGDRDSYTPLVHDVLREGAALPF
ncbi:MAG: methyltransferase, partial [Rhodobacterales bacterium]|nr:methyltransferase [Rhodobacterales bacterium]MDX5413329.1 methyltransferase [Rhodobacterales bacterium]